MRAEVRDTYINASVGLAQWPATVHGILANANGHANQIEARTGAVLTAPFAFADLYHGYADSWRVPAKESLLSVCGEGEVEVGIPTKPFYAKDLEPQVYKRARAVCAAAGVKERTLLDACTLDVAVIGRDSAAEVFVGLRAPVATATVTTHRLAGFLDIGAGVPQGTFSNTFKTGISLNAGLEYLIGPRVSAEGILGLHHFPNKDAGNLDIYQLSVNAKVYAVAPPSTLRPFANVGVGTYAFSPGSSHAGANIGVGVLWERTPRFGLQGSYNFHTVNTSGAATKFSTIQGGIRVVF